MAVKWPVLRWLSYWPLLVWTDVQIARWASTRWRDMPTSGVGLIVFAVIITIWVVVDTGREILRRFNAGRRRRNRHPTVRGA
jgi:hypothetical protein